MYIYIDNKLNCWYFLILPTRFFDMRTHASARFGYDDGFDFNHRIYRVNYFIVCWILIVRRL